MRTNITLVEMCNTFPDKVYTFTINSKSQDKWHLAAADEVRENSEDYNIFFIDLTNDMPLSDLIGH